MNGYIYKNIFVYKLQLLGLDESNNPSIFLDSVDDNIILSLWPPIYYGHNFY